MLINHGFNTMTCFIQGVNELLTEVTLQSQDLYDFLQSIHFLGPGSLLPVQSNIKLVLDALYKILVAKLCDLPLSLQYVRKLNQRV